MASLLQKKVADRHLDGGRRCPHCHSHSVKSFLRYRERESLRCRECGGLFNRPGRDTRPLYDQVYFEEVYTPRMEEQLSRSGRLLDVIRQFTPNGSVLDYGCGTGIFLLAARESSFTDNVGADVSADGLRIARNNLGEGVTLIHLPFEGLPERKFQVIALMDTISAVPDARATVCDLASQYLADGGVLAIRTPHVGLWYFRLVKFLSFPLGKKHASRFMFATSRYALFDIASLRRLLTSLGLQVVFFELGRDYAVPPSTKGIAGPFWAILWRLLHRRSILMIAKAPVSLATERYKAPTDPELIKAAKNLSAMSGLFTTKLPLSLTAAYRSDSGKLTEKRSSARPWLTSALRAFVALMWPGLQISDTVFPRSGDKAGDVPRDVEGGSALERGCAKS